MLAHYTVQKIRMIDCFACHVSITTTVLNHLAALSHHSCFPLGLQNVHPNSLVGKE